MLLIFGFLHYRFSNLPSDVSDIVASDAILKSIELRWSKADQAVFIAAVILNPIYMLEPFADLQEFSEMEIEALLVRLWQRFFPTTPTPPALYEDINQYLHKKERFQHIDANTKSKLEQAKMKV